MIAIPANHLWQSSAFAGLAGLLTILFRKNRAQVRYWLWVSASFKFFVPFSLLMGVGSRLEWPPAARVAPPAVTSTMVQITEPFPAGLPAASVTPEAAVDWTPFVAGLWACGFGAIALMRLRDWRRIRAAVRASAPRPIREGMAALEVRSSPGWLEPGVVGVWRPILLLPAGIEERLTAAQMEAVIAHEWCHVRRRDNLMSAIHMAVEAVFWFHPLVWWIGARLVEERERACDEAVISLGNEPLAYAEGILNVCKFYTKSPLSCVSGVTGADLKKRLEAIMTNRISLRLNFGKKLLLAGAGILAASAPLLVGLLKAQSEAPLAFEVASVRQHLMPVGYTIRFPSGSNLECPPFHCGISGTRFTEEMASLRNLIAEAYEVKEFQIDGLPDWGASGKDVYDINAKAEGDRTPTPGDVRRMLRTLLAQRFQLKIRREAKVLPVYALVVAKGGMKLAPGDNVDELIARDAAGRKASAPPVERKGGGGGGGGRFGGQTMERLAALLSGMADRPVLDKTGIEGSYKLNGRDPMIGLDLREIIQNRRGDPDGGASGVTIFTEVQEKWGLRLEPRKAPTEMLVIEHVARPSEN